MQTTSNGSGRCLTSIAAAACAVLATSSAAAQTAKEKELEQRVQQLEEMVREMKKSSGAATAPATAPAATAAPAAAATPPPVQARTITPNAAPNTKFFYSGFIKLDGIMSQFDDGEIADSTLGRDFYLPATVPVGGVKESEDLTMHAKQSRFIFGTDTDLADKRTLSTRLEVDLYGSATGQGDQRATNTYGVQLRHAYVSYGRWLLGQTWSNFQDVGALPETADFIGPTDGTVFVRQAQVRYTAGNFSLSLENPETVITPFGGVTATNARISSDDNNVPDLTAAYTFKFGPHYIRAAALGRQLKHETTTTEDSQFVGALSLAGKFMLGKDDIRFMVTGGDAIGRYVGVNFTNDAVLTAGGDLEAISGWAAFAAYRHVWNDKLRSTLMVSTSEYDNEVPLTGLAANKGSFSWAFNTFYSPFPKLDLGIEFRQAEREIESGLEGEMSRLHATARYSF